MTKEESVREYDGKVVVWEKRCMPELVENYKRIMPEQLNNERWKNEDV